MRLRFLASGLAFFGVVFLLAALPVVAQGRNTPGNDRPCPIKAAPARTC
jgi:hypothetical protein